MLPFLTLLLVCQLAGEVIARLAGLPVPGPVVGLVLLFLGLTLHGQPAPVVEENADRLLQHLSLLFVPAGVGVVQYLSLLAEEWLPIAASIVGSAIAAMVATGLTLRLLTRGPAPDEAEPLAPAGGAR